MGVASGLQMGMASGPPRGVASGPQRGVALGPPRSVTLGPQRGVAWGPQTSVALGPQTGVAWGPQAGTGSVLAHSIWSSSYYRLMKTRLHGSGPVEGTVSKCQGEPVVCIPCLTPSTGLGQRHLLDFASSLSPSPFSAQCLHPSDGLSGRSLGLRASVASWDKPSLTPLAREAT